VPGHSIISRVPPGKANVFSWPKVLLRPDQELTSAGASLAEGRVDVSAGTSVGAEVKVDSRKVSAESAPHRAVPFAYLPVNRW
jgi:hypothetical protein